MEGISEVAVHAAESHLVLESLKIMVVGMVTVFAFLWLLIMVLKVQGWFLTKFFPEKPAAATAPAAVAPSGAPEKSDNLAAVIMAAVNLHRKRKSK
ncbi:MAG: OadG family protein [Campylobacterales bacterium]